MDRVWSTVPLDEYRCETNLRLQELTYITSLQIHSTMVLLQPYVFLPPSVRTLVSSSQRNSKETVSFTLTNKSSALIMHFKLHRLESSSWYERYYQCNEQISSTVHCLLLHYFHITLKKLRGCKLPSNSATDNALVQTIVTYSFCFFPPFLESQIKTSADIIC